MVCKRPHGVSPAVSVNGVVVPWGRNMFPMPPRAFVPVHPVPAIPIPKTVDGHPFDEATSSRI